MFSVSPLTVVSLVAVLSVPAFAQGVCDNPPQPPPLECPIPQDCPPIDLEICGDHLRTTPLGFCDVNGNECFGCMFCDLPCPTLPCDAITTPCALLIDTTFPFNGRTCAGCRICKLLPQPYSLESPTGTVFTARPTFVGRHPGVFEGITGPLRVKDVNADAGVDGGPEPGVLCTAFFQANQSTWQCTSTVDLVDGTYTVMAFVGQQATNPLTFTVQTQPPRTFINGGPPALTNQVRVDFALSSDRADAGFECRVDQAPFAICDAGVTLDVPGDGPHRFEARAFWGPLVDDAGAHWDWELDATPPAAPRLTAPDAGAMLATATPQLQGEAEPGSVVVVELDGDLFLSSADGSGQWSLTVPVSLMEGAHQVSATARDAAGNTSPATALSFSVFLTAPQTTFTLAPPALTASTMVPYALESDLTGVTFECQLNDAGFAPCPASGALAVSDGTSLLEARAVRGPLVDASPAAAVFEVDSTPPAPPAITSPPAGVLVAAPTVADGAAEAGGSVEVALDGTVLGTAAVTATGTWSIGLPALGDGPHRLEAVAVDRAGNRSPATERDFTSSPAADAGRPDAGAEDGGRADAGGGEDGGFAGVDAGWDAGATTEPPTGSGCGCAAVPPAWPLLAFVFWLLRRRAR